MNVLRVKSVNLSSEDQVDGTNIYKIRMGSRTGRESARKRVQHIFVSSVTKITECINKCMNKPI